MPAGFVGRASELAILLKSAASGGPSCVLVEGEGGSGKTSLLRVFQDSLTSGWVVTAAGDEAEEILPYGVLDQLSRQLPSVGATRRRQQGHCGDPFAVGAEFLQQLGRASQSGPLVLVIDDAHLADSPSLLALTFAARRLLADAVVVVLTAREEKAAGLPPGLLRLVNDRGSQIRLGGFSTEEVREFSEAVGFGRLSTRAAARLRDHTGGNPLHVRALLSELTREQAEAIETPLPVPRSLAMLVVASLAGTPPDAQALAAAAAALGVSTTLHDAAAVAGLEDARAAADELSRASIMHAVDAPAGPSLRFLHPLVRAAVYNNTGLVARARLHARAANMTSGAEALRHRVLAARGPDPELVAALLAQAADDHSHGRLGTAPAALLSASHLSGPGPDRDRLFLRAVDLFVVEGDLISATRHAPALERMPRTAQRLHVQARMAWLSGHLDEAQALGRQAWDRAHDLEPAEADELAALLAQIAVLRDEGGVAAEWAQRALASGLLPTEVAVATRATGALGLGVSGRARDGIAMLGYLPADPCEVPPDQRQLLGMRGLLRMFIDDLDSSRADLEQVVSSMNRGLRPHQLTALGALAEVEYRTGNWDRSSSLAHQLVGLVEDTGQGWLFVLAHALSVLVSAARGQWERAERHVQATRQALDMVKTKADRAYAESAAVHLAYCRGDLEGVVAGARRLLAVGSGALLEPGILWSPPQYASALVGLHRIDEADAVLREMEHLARQRQHRSRLAVLARVRGELEVARGQTTTARTAFVEAVRLGAGPGDALETAVTHAAYGRFLRRRGERRNATHHLQIAQDAFIHLGAEPFLARCQTELDACGRATTGATTQAAHTALTPQEFAVARLVAAGRSNKEIADELVLSVKTIAYHLTHVYAKLGIRSRTELAARWAVLASSPRSLDVSPMARTT